MEGLYHSKKAEEGGASLDHHPDMKSARTEKIGGHTEVGEGVGGGPNTKEGIPDLFGKAFSQNRDLRGKLRGRILREEESEKPSAQGTEAGEISVNPRTVGMHMSFHPVIKSNRPRTLEPILLDFY